MSAVCIKPRMVQTICLALMGPRGRLLCQLWDHPAWLRGFGLLGRCIVPMSYREASVFGPMRSLMIFGLTPAFRAPPAGCVWSGVVPSKEMHGTAAAAARRSNRCRIVSGCGGRPLRG